MNFVIKLITVLLLVFIAETGYAFQCSVTTTPVNFGFYDPLSSSDLNSTGGITVTCNAPANFAGIISSRFSNRLLP